MAGARFLPGVACAAALAIFGSSAAPGAGADRRCHAEVDHGVLPVWARAGFSGPKPRIAHVVGRSRRIVAILFGHPLRAPPTPGRNNKILWVPRMLAAGRGALWIRAQRMNGNRPVGTPVRGIVSGGPGPSIVDVREAGCWRFTLNWSGRTDTLDLEYGTGSRPAR